MRVSFVCFRRVVEGDGSTMPVSGSMERERVSTAITWVDLSFQGQYLRQLAVETSSQE